MTHINEYGTDRSSHAPAGSAVPAEGSDTVGRFLSRGGFTGRLEAVGGGDAPPPTDDEVRKLAETLASAAQDDPLAFEILGGHRAEPQIRESLSTAVEAIRKNGRKAALTGPELNTLEAIILLTGRPVLFIKNDTFEVPTGEWEFLAPYRPTISKAAKSVGRIAAAPDYGRPFEGSGFMVGPGLIMTNRHVVCRYAMRGADRWILDPGCRLVIDFKQEFGVAEKAEFPIDGIFWMADEEDVDVALLKLDLKAIGNRALPEPLRLQKDAGYANVGNTVYVVGYPAADPSRNDPDEMHRIYRGIYEKKRLAPGRISSMADNSGILYHDCSTLGGNSGSCVMDLATNSVIGLHFEGSYQVSNTAVVLPALANSPPFAELNWQEGPDA